MDAVASAYLKTRIVITSFTVNVEAGGEEGAGGEAGVGAGAGADDWIPKYGNYNLCTVTDTFSLCKWYLESYHLN